MPIALEGLILLDKNWNAQMYMYLGEQDSRTIRSTEDICGQGGDRASSGWALYRSQVCVIALGETSHPRSY